jgi:chemotaxis protein MotB
MIYRRRLKRKQVRHADDWLMTYADMITLLLCFFVLFASASIAQKINAAKVHVAQKEEKTQKSAPAEPRVEATADKMSEQVPPQDSLPEFQAPPELGAEAGIYKMLEQVPPQDSLPETVGNLQSKTAANPKQDGDRITSIEMNSAAFFDRGSAALSPEGEAILRDVAENLKAEKFQDYQVTVEGHTDDIPINTPLFPSNWELSTARAAAVVRFFLNEGIPAHRLRAAGYADTFPKVPNRDENGSAIPENQAKNRRVVIKLEKIEKTT